MDKAIKQLLNSLKCPICSSQIDILQNYYTTFVCISNSDHYTITLHKNLALIETETLNFFDPHDYNRIYQIYKFYKDNGQLNFCTIIKYQMGEKNKGIKLAYDPINFKYFSIEKAINRIKNIFIYQ